MLAFLPTRCTSLCRLGCAPGSASGQGLPSTSPSLCPSLAGGQRISLALVTGSWTLNGFPTSLTMPSLVRKLPPGQKTRCCESQVQGYTYLRSWKLLRYYLKLWIFCLLDVDRFCLTLKDNELPFAGAFTSPQALRATKLGSPKCTAGQPHLCGPLTSRKMIGFPLVQML